MVEPGFSVKQITANRESKVETLNTVLQKKMRFILNGCELPTSFSFEKVGVTDGSVILCISIDSTPNQKALKAFPSDLSNMIQCSVDPSISREKARLLDLRQDQIDNNPKKFRTFLKLQNFQDRDW